MLQCRQAVTASSATTLNKVPHRISENEVKRAISYLEHDLAQNHSIVGLGDYHDDDELKIFFINILPHLRSAGYKKFCIEYPHKHQQKLHESLILFSQDRIGFEDLKRVVCEHDGKQYWNFTQNTQNLFTAMIARAAKLNMEIVAMDVGFDDENSTNLRERNKLWVSKIHEKCDLNSPEKIIIFGGAFHFNGPNLHSDSDTSECELATGIDLLIKDCCRSKKFTIFTIPQRAIRTHERRNDYDAQLSSTKADKYYGEEYHFVGLPALRQGDIARSIAEVLGANSEARWRAI